jgi:hypothetical protein
MPRDRDRDAELPRVYEGAELLAALLEAAGSAVPVDALKSAFLDAQAHGARPDQVFPALFETEPHFPTPEHARRLYGNLFGLWDRLARGVRDEPRAAEPPPPAEPVPPPPPIEGRELPDAFVEAALGALTTLPGKERTRQRDRFEQKESELCEALRLLRLSPGAEQAGLDLAFELWLLCGWALGARAGHAAFGRLRAPAPAGTQPALERFVAEWLGEAELDDDEPLTAEERGKLEPFLRQAAELLAP